MQKKKSEEARKALVDPLNKHVKFINEQFKPSRETLDAAINVGKGKLKTWMDKIAAEEAAQAEAARKQEEEERLERAAELEDAGMQEEADALLESAEELPSAPRSGPVRGDFGGTSSSRATYTVRASS